MNDEHEMQTLGEIAATYHTTTAALYASRHRGNGPRGVRIGRKLLFSRDDIEAWLEQNREPADGH